MLNRVQKVLEENCALDSKQPVIVGVSGGADSLTLLNILVLGYPVVAAHFNHLLRSESSDDARKVEGIAIKLGIPFSLGEGDAAEYAREHAISIEEAAREVRYRFLFDQAGKYDAQAVAVAHNADDQIETVLMHLLRGAGLDGLTGMPYRSLPNPWSETIPLVRPLLGIKRAEIEIYCAENDLAPVLDLTNTDTSFFRNRLRHELIPELETYIPGFRNRLCQTAELLAADRVVLDELTEEIWQEVIENSDTGYVSINRETFNFQPLGIKRRLIRKAVSCLRSGARDLDFSMVQRVIEFAREPSLTGQSDIGLGLRVFLEDGKLIIATWEAELPTFHWPQIAVDKSLSVPGELNLGSGWILRADVPKDLESAQIEAAENIDPYRIWLDLGKRNPLLGVRQRRPGDRFQPLGMGGKSMKVSDFMINQKIPQRARAGWPLILSGDEIVWVPGYQMGHPFRLRTVAKQIVKLSLQSG
jgi:tRNA(Ile)-lysidine synthase